MVAGGNRLSPTEADSGDGDRVSGGGIYSPPLTNSQKEGIIKIQKGKTSNGYATLNCFEIVLTGQRGGYLTFIVSTNKNIIVSIITLNICFFIVITLFPDYY